MADGARDKGDHESRQADDAALAARLGRLGERLDETGAPVTTGSTPRSTADPSALARGFRLTAELVVAVLAGAGLGWLIDRWLGTSPWGFIVLLLLGFAAGVVGVIRAAGIAPGSGVSPGNRGD
jgi:ATP synthase protein I